MSKPNTEFRDALRKFLQTQPDMDSALPGVKDVGAALADAIKEAGYTLECHQTGIHGTRLLVVPMKTIKLSGIMRECSDPMVND